MIKLENVSKYYSNNGVVSLGLRHINLELNRNEIVAITGESGGGKSTLLNVITKMDSFDEGEIYYLGNETSYFSIDDMDNFRKDKIGFIFQNYNIIDSYTVLENVMVPLYIKGLGTKEAKQKAIEIIKRVGLEKRMNHRGTKLSGGEKQRCVIARALASDCDILACDEPTGNLDSKTGNEIIALIKEIAQDKLVLIVTHNFEQVASIATRKIVVADGQIIEDTKLKNVEAHDENKALDLDYKPVKAKTNIRIATKNLLFTPRRTFLTCCIFFFVALFSLAMYQYIYKTNSNIEYYNELNYTGDNKVIVYAKHGDTLDKNKLDEKFDDIMYNYYNVRGMVRFNTGNYDQDLYTCYEKTLKNPKPLYGRIPENENEAYLALPQGYYTSKAAKSLLNSSISRIFSMTDVLTNITISGVEIRSDIKYPTLSMSQAIEILYVNFGIYGSPYTISMYFTDPTYSEKIIASIEYIEGTELYIKTNVNGIIFDEENSSLDNPIVLPMDNIKYEENDNPDYVTIYVPLGRAIDDVVYEACIYGNTNDILKQLEKLDYGYINVSTYSTVSKLQTILNNISAYIAMIVSTLAVVILYFISYLILSKVYISKLKDYTILRTLGVTKRDMRHIVTFEVMIQTVTVTILSYVLINTLAYTLDNSFFMNLRGLTFVSTLLYFVVMILFAYFMARRFNRKLFKFTVKGALNQEVAR